MARVTGVPALGLPEIAEVLRRAAADDAIAILEMRGDVLDPPLRDDQQGTRGSAGDVSDAGAYA